MVVVAFFSWRFVRQKGWPVRTPARFLSALVAFSRFLNDVVACSQRPHLFRADLLPKPEDGSQNRCLQSGRTWRTDL